MNVSVLYETCNVGEKLLDISRETEKSLVDLFKSKNICAYLNVSPGSTKSIKGKLFKQIDNNLIFLPAFAVTETADGSTFYILKSIAMQENSIVIGRQYQFSATGQITDPQPEVSGPVYMEGIFGFKADKSGSCRRIEKACLKRINCYDKVLFNIHFDPKKYEVLLYPQMPPRYQADPFFEKLGQISQIIMPKGVGVFIPMSSKVKMKVRKL